MTPLQETKTEIAKRFMAEAEAYRPALEEHTQCKALAMRLHDEESAEEEAANAKAMRARQIAAFHAEGVLHIFRAYREETGLDPLAAGRDLQKVCDWIAERGREYEAAHPMPTTREGLGAFVAELVRAAPDARRAFHPGFVAAPDVRETHNAALDFWQRWRADWAAHLAG